MKWFLVAVGTIAALILAATLIGMTLPMEHAASRRAKFRQTPAELFAVLSGPPDWRSDITRVEKLDPVNGRERWKEFGARGGGVLYELVESAPPLRRSVRIADDTLPYGGTWTFELIPIAGGSLLRITERGEVRNPFFRFVSRFVMGNTRSIEQFLSALGKKFGEPVVIEEDDKPWGKGQTATPS